MHSATGKSLLAFLLLPGISAVTADALANDYQLCLESGDSEVALRVEVADDPRERARGLMEREQLAADAGMLFLYRQIQSPDQAFWMYRTRIPLDIAFIGPGGEIRAIRSMTPCRDSRRRHCPSYPAGVEFQSALEVNRGWFAAHNITEGHRLRLADEQGCAPAAGTEPSSPPAP